MAAPSPHRILSPDLQAAPPRRRTVRLVAGLLLMVHGLVHAMGVAIVWDLGDLEGMSGTTSIELADPAVKVLGVLWAVAMIGFVSAGAALLTRRRWWRAATAISVVISIPLVVVWWTDAKAGLVANLAAVALLTAANTLDVPTRRSDSENP